MDVKLLSLPKGWGAEGRAMVREKHMTPIKESEIEGEVENDF